MVSRPTARLKRLIKEWEVVVATAKGKLHFRPWEQIPYGEFDGQWNSLSWIYPVWRPKINQHSLPETFFTKLLTPQGAPKLYSPKKVNRNKTVRYRPVRSARVILWIQGGMTETGLAIRPACERSWQDRTTPRRSVQPGGCMQLSNPTARSANRMAIRGPARARRRNSRKALMA